MHRGTIAGKALLIGTAFFAPHAMAQDSVGLPLQLEEQASVGVADIVVTAQRRSESVQDVPIAVSVLSSAELSGRGIASTADL